MFFKCSLFSISTFIHCSPVREEVWGWEGAGIPYRAWRRRGKQVFPCSLWRGLWWSRHSHCSPWRTPHWHRWTWPKRSCIHGEPSEEQGPGRSCGPGHENHAGAGLSWGTAALGKDPRTGRSVRWKKWQRGTGMDWLQLPFSSHCTAQWGYGMEEEEELGKEKWSWDWKKVVGESYFSVLFCLCFTAFNSILLIY